MAWPTDAARPRTRPARARGAAVDRLGELAGEEEAPGALAADDEEGGRVPVALDGAGEDLFARPCPETALNQLTPRLYHGGTPASCSSSFSFSFSRAEHENENEHEHEAGPASMLQASVRGPERPTDGQGPPPLEGAGERTGERAYRADLAAGLPHIALKCAREFELGDDKVNAAASALVTLLLDKKRFGDALEVARGFNLIAGAEAVQAKLIEDARRIDVTALDEQQKAAVAEIKRMAGAAVNKRARTTSADEALEAIAAATRARNGDSRVKGRAVFLPAEGDLYLTGDLHGNVENLRRFAATADLDAHPDRILVIQEIIHSRIITADQRDLSFVAILEALKLMARWPKRVYYLLGNHDLAFALDRELIKGGKFLNRFLYKGLAYMYQARHEEVAKAYKKFVLDMPAAILAPNGIIMTHSTPKRPFIPSLSMEDPTTTSAHKHLGDCGPIKALVEGRDFEETTIDQFTARMGVNLVLCGHTPTKHGFRIANSKQLDHRLAARERPVGPLRPRPQLLRGRARRRGAADRAGEHLLRHCRRIDCKAPSSSCELPRGGR